RSHDIWWALRRYVSSSIQPSRSIVLDRSTETSPTLSTKSRGTSFFAALQSLRARPPDRSAGPPRAGTLGNAIVFAWRFPTGDDDHDADWNARRTSQLPATPSGAGSPPGRGRPDAPGTGRHRAAGSPPGRSNLDGSPR